MSNEHVHPQFRELLEFLRDPYGVADGTLARIREPQPAIALVEALPEDLWDEARGGNEANSVDEAKTKSEDAPRDE